MKRLFALSFLLMTLSSCGYFIMSYPVFVFEPVYITWEELRSSFESCPPRTIGVAGKIYAYGDFLLVNEPWEGTHVIDNRDPFHPRQIAFLSIPGNIDIAVRDGVLYADSYTDLVCADLSGLLKGGGTAVIKNRLTNIFPHNVTRGDIWQWRRYRGHSYTTHLPYNITNGIVTNWRQVATETHWEPGTFFRPWIVYEKYDSASSSGTGGSMARFTVVGAALYTVEQDTMKVFDISQTGGERLAGALKLSNYIETVFPYNDYLFIGSMQGMGLYKIEKGRTLPEFIAWTSHRFSRDPVIFDGSYAYVTLLRGELQVYDMSDMASAKRTNVFWLHEPRGLAILGKTLYVCCQEGLAVFDASRAPHFTQISNFAATAAYFKSAYDADDLYYARELASSHPYYYPGTNMHGSIFYDAIPLGTRLLVSSSEGIYQLDCRAPFEPKVISVIAVTNNDYYRYRMSW